MRTVTLLAFLLPAMALLISCTSGVPSKGNESLETQPVILESESGERVEILAEIADEPEARARGLMFREDLPEGRGMLFVFESEQPLAFWMKNTLISLDILYFDASGRFVSAAAMVPCREDRSGDAPTDRCPSYPSEGPVRYALEASAGFVERHAIGNGWRVRW